MQYFNCISAVHPTHLRVNHARNVPYNYEWRHPRLSMTRWIFVAKSSAMQFKFDFAKYSPESLRLHYAKKHLSFSVLPAFCILFLKTKFLSILSLCLHLFYLKGCTKIFISNDWILLLMGGHPRTHCFSNDLEGSWEFLLWRRRAHCGGWLGLTDGPTEWPDWLPFGLDGVKLPSAGEIYAAGDLLLPPTKEKKDFRGGHESRSCGPHLTPLGTSCFILWLLSRQKLSALHARKGEHDRATDSSWHVTGSKEKLVCTVKISEDNACLK